MDDVMNVEQPAPGPSATLDRSFITFLLIFFSVLAVLFRFGLSSVNTEANDDHLMVMREILSHDWSPPGREVCWEAYHAKLYHYAAAASYAVSGFEINSGTAYLANFVSMLAGLGTLGILLRCAWSGLGTLTWRPETRILVYGFFALWPSLIVISSQATNDSFLIFFSTACLYCLYSFLEAGRTRDGALAIVFMILAVSSKATGWCIFGLTMMVMGVKVAVESGPRRRRLVLFSAACAVAFLSAACLQHPYRGYIRDYGTPFKGALIEETPPPLPDLFQKTCYQKPGVLSIADAFLTFRAFDLLQNPYVENGMDPVPRHRTSFWSQLYGRTFFARFDQWPPSWQTRDPVTLSIGRACLVLGLPAAVVFFTGICLSVRRLVEGVRRQGPAYLRSDHSWMFIVYVVALIGMVAVLSTIHRSFSWMKVIYFLPATLGLFTLFADGLDYWLARSPGLARTAFGGVGLLVFAFSVDTALLVHDLAKRG